MAKDGKGGERAHKPRPPFRAVEGIGSNAWDRLSRNGVFVLIKFYRKFNGFNRYDLSLTYVEVRKKMTNRPFSDAVLELISFGFIDLRRPGRLERQCSIYSLSDRWRRLSKDPKRLDQIEALLRKIILLRREKGGIKKRVQINKLRKQILQFGTGR